MSRDYMRRMLRREARPRMTARAKHTRGEYPNVETIHECLPCTPRPTSGRANRDIQTGVQTSRQYLYDVRVPWDSDVREGDVFHLIRSDDPKMIGRWLTIVEDTTDEWGAVRYVTCVEGRPR
ncbi:hypothetical protein G1H11_14155 [Phytoactinopolyspora alkaliphila]|uniref:Uncharacterized protein n=1 Tax=Phytoactinopolyspora alkaliphila TaxID=1783498 RepID=A0A6N9YNN6_9ACTN|nr:DUF6093 family protein [Phytoactinopolyspora alkaliphila]NED96449.1 hypothetical protein [Phytoactinopolyspora alkaliphila]